MLANKPFVASNISTIRESVPDFYLTELIDENSTRLYKQRILELIQKKDEAIFYRISEWANNQFDESKRFKEFLNEILN